MHVRLDPQPRRDAGFSLIELLVVILIIAILAAIAIPVFLRQRERGYEAQLRSAVKNAASAVEAYAARNQGDYAGLDGGTGGDLVPWGYRTTGGVTISVDASSTAYCVTADHADISDEWKFTSSVGAPQPGACSGASG